MAASNSRTDIANKALIFLGQSLINDLDSTTFNATVMATFYDDARQFVLRAAAWRFALTRQMLQAETDTPVHTWDYQFLLPANCMLLHRVGTDDALFEANDDYVVERGRILCNANDELPVTFVDDIDDVASFPSDFKMCMAAYLAHLGAPVILQSTEKTDAMLKLYEYYLAQAQNTNAIENKPRIKNHSNWNEVHRTLSRTRKTTY